MKKIIILSSVFVLFALVLTGCNSQTNNTSGQDLKKFDFEQPEDRPDIMGLIKSVSGNEVTVLVMNMPDREGDKNEGESSSDTKARVGLSTNSAPRGMGANRSGDSRGGSSDSMLEMIKQNSTGEEAVVIPVGIQMLKPVASDSRNPEFVEANLNDIKKDKMISIWLDEDVSDRNIAEFVLIK